MKENKGKIVAMPNRTFETMKVEHRFFTEGFLLSNEVMREIEAEKASQSEEEKALENQKLSKEFMAIVKQAEAEREKILRLPNDNKQELFHTLVEVAEVLGEACIMDVFAEITEDGYGTITFCFNYAFILEDMPSDFRILFGTLIASCTSMHMGPVGRNDKERMEKVLKESPDEQLTEIVLVYNLYDEVEK